MIIHRSIGEVSGVPERRISGLVVDLFEGGLFILVDSSRPVRSLGLDVGFVDHLRARGGLVRALLERSVEVETDTVAHPTGVLLGEEEDEGVGGLRGVVVGIEC